MNRCLIALQSVPLRVGLVFIAAALPLIILLGLWAPNERSGVWVVVATLLGAGIAVWGLDVVIAAPLRRLGVGIDGWRAGGGFDAHRTARSRVRVREKGMKS